MSSDNPYQPPSTSVELTSDKTDDVWSFVEPQKVPIGRGLGWIGDGFRYFGQSAGIWILITIIYFVILIFSSFVPFATNILQPMLVGGLMIGLHNQDNGGSLEVQHLFEGFNQAASKLALLGALILGITILMMIAMLIILFIGIAIVSALDSSGGPSPVVIATLLLIGIPIMLAVMLVLMSVSWFGPPLVALHDLPVGEAFKMSIQGLKRNILPFIVFTFFMMLLFMLSALTFYLGLLVVIPVLMAASYASWKDVFTHANSQNQAVL